MPAKPNNTVTDTTITCRTRTGKKLHRAYPGSSVTFCGVWLKTNASNMQVNVANAPGCFRPAWCEHCFPNGGTLDPAPARPTRDELLAMPFAELMARTSMSGINGLDARQAVAQLNRRAARELPVVSNDPTEIEHARDEYARAEANLDYRPRSLDEMLRVLGS